MGVKKCTRVHGPSTRPMNSGSGNRALETGMSSGPIYVYVQDALVLIINSLDCNITWTHDCSDRVSRVDVQSTWQPEKVRKLSASKSRMVEHDPTIHPSVAPLPSELIAETSSRALGTICCVAFLLVHAVYSCICNLSIVKWMIVHWLNSDLMLYLNSAHHLKN